MPATSARPTVGRNDITVTEQVALDAAVIETMGADAPRECFKVAADIFGDALQHARTVRGLNGYRQPLNRADALADALETIRSC